MKKFVLTTLLVMGSLSVANATVINRMTTNTFGGYSQTYGQYDRGLMILGSADDYLLDDGSSWSSGAGWRPNQYADIANTYVEGSTINYELDMGIGDIIFQNTDYNSGNHSAQGVLTTTHELTLSAIFGSTTAKLEGYVEIMSNNETWYGEPRFNYYGANVGDLVYFEVEYQLLRGDIWNLNTFNKKFSYNLSGLVDFTKVTSVAEPSSFILLLLVFPLLLAGRITKAAKHLSLLRFGKL
jgi:hypothetical protein